MGKSVEKGVITTDRRTFMKGAALVGAAAAVSGLVGCSPKTSDDTGSDDAVGNRWQSAAAVSWHTAPNPIDESKIADGGTYDVIVVGGGESGLWTTRSTSKNGLSVAVIEMQTEENHMWIGGEVGTINSQWALSHGARTIDPQEFMREVFRRNEGRSDQRLIKDYVEHSGELLDWAIQDIDTTWMEENTHIGSCPPDDRMVMDPSDYKFYTGTTIFRSPSAGLSEWNWGPTILSHHRDQSIADGAVWNYNQHAEYLEKDGSGRVVSVVVLDQEGGTYLRYTATKGIILTGGDFAGNEDMMRDINDEYRHLAESLGDIELATVAPMMLTRDGSVIQMGVWAGGHIEVGPHSGMNTGQAGPETPWGPGSPMLNQNGLRFCDECAGGTEGSAYLVPRQPKGSVVAINDANWQDLVYTMPPAHEAVDYRRSQGWPETVDSMNAVQPGDKPTTAIAYSSQPDVYCAQTIEELVKIVGIWDESQQKAAIAEIEKYQGYCQNGEDEDFAKDSRILAVTRLDTPPYYAVVGSTTSINPGLCQTTGLDTDYQHHVLDDDLAPIPGLFAAGNDSGNRFIVQYATPLSGMSLGFCLTEGMLLGQRIASGEIS